MPDKKSPDPEPKSAEPKPVNEKPKVEAPPAKKRDPIRLVTRIVLALCLIIFLWYLVADRLTPFTDQAHVQALVVPIVPRVSGYITEVNIKLHSIVSEGDVLIQIDKRPYEMAVRAAEAQLDTASQDVGSRSAAVKSAAGRLGVARARLDRAQRNYNRTQKILEANPGALSQADRDLTETSLDQAKEQVASAEADLEKAERQLGTEGAGNPQIRAAVAALEQAQLNLAFTAILAPSHGVIESFNLDVGYYAATGQPLATFVSTYDVWIQADMRENNISHIKPGNRVEFVLDVSPGRVFEGTVRSVGYGVSVGGGLVRGDLPTISGSSSGWLRDPQRFPVIIGMDREEAKGLRRSGGQVDVLVYTGEYPILNDIAGLYLRVRSLFSYVR